MFFAAATSGPRNKGSPDHMSMVWALLTPSPTGALGIVRGGGSSLKGPTPQSWLEGQISPWLLPKGQMAGSSDMGTSVRFGIEISKCPHLRMGI